MDVATVKKNYADANASGKSKTNVAEKLMGDFSKAVAERMKQAGSVGAGSHKNALVSNLAAKASPKANTHHQKDMTDRNDQAARRDEPKFNEPDNAPKARDDAPVQDNSASSQEPHESTQKEASDAPADHNQDNSSHDDPSSSHDSAQEDGAEHSTAQAGNSDANDNAVAGEAQVAALTPLANVPVVKGSDKQTTSTKDVKTTATETVAPQQKVQKSAEAVQSANAGDITSDDNGETGDALQKTAASKGKSSAQQAKSGVNTHTKIDGQAEADKGATVAQQQASELSKKIGPDQALNVKVNVKHESDDLVSKPSVNLVGQAKDKSESLTPTTAQATPKGQTGQSAAHTTGGQTGSDAQGQNQQQAQLQAAQADATKLAATAADAKAQQTSNTGNSTAQVAKVGGVEGASTTQNATPTANTQQNQQAQQTAKAHTAPQHHARTAVTEQVTVQISKAINDGNDKIRIQLKPAHLGRVDVQLDVSQDGRVTAVISADNKDTMDLLKQDSRELEKAMREAGLNLDSGDLSFNLRGQNGNSAEGQETAQNSTGPSAPVVEPSLQELLDMQPGRPQIISEDRVDITA